MKKLFQKEKMMYQQDVPKEAFDRSRLSVKTFSLRMIMLIIVLSGGYSSVYSQCNTGQNSGVRYVDDVFDYVDIDSIVNVPFALVQNSDLWSGLSNTDCWNHTADYLKSQGANLWGLTMTIYMPRNSLDGCTERALIISAHGSGFVAEVNVKENDAQTSRSRKYARKGYVVAAIDYRKGWNLNSSLLVDPRSQAGPASGLGTCDDGLNDNLSYTRAIFRMAQDFRAAHRFLHNEDLGGEGTPLISNNPLTPPNEEKFGAELRVDVNKVIYEGASTGAWGAMFAGFANNNSYWTSVGINESIGGFGGAISSPTLEGTISIIGVVNEYGAVNDLSIFNDEVEDQDIPLYNLSGSADDLVQYFEGYILSATDYYALDQLYIYGGRGIYEYITANNNGHIVALNSVMNLGHAKLPNEDGFTHCWSSNEAISKTWSPNFIYNVLEGTEENYHGKLFFSENPVPCHEEVDDPYNMALQFDGDMINKWNNTNIDLFGVQITDPATQAPDILVIDLDNTLNPEFQFGSNEFTVELKIQTTENGEMVLLGTGPNITQNTGTPLYVRLIDGNIHVSSYYIIPLVGQPLGNFSTSGLSLDDGTCHHIAITRDGNTMHIYVDGDLKKSQNIGGGAFTFDAFYFGSYYNLNPFNNPILAHHGKVFKGFMDEIRIWSDARTEAELFNNMNNYLNPLEEDLIGYWTLDRLDQRQTEFNAVTSNGMPYATLGYHTLNGIQNTTSGLFSLSLAFDRIFDPHWVSGTKLSCVNECNDIGVEDAVCLNEPSASALWQLWDIDLYGTLGWEGYQNDYEVLFEASDNTSELFTNLSRPFLLASTSSSYLNNILAALSGSPYNMNSSELASKLLDPTLSYDVKVRRKCGAQYSDYLLVTSIGLNGAFCGGSCPTSNCRVGKVSDQMANMKERFERDLETTKLVVEDDNISVYPNPMNYQSTIRIQLEKDAAVRLSVVNSLGQEVKVLEDASFKQGESNITFDRTSLANGHYLIKAEIDDVVKTIPIVILD